MEANYAIIKDNYVINVVRWDPEAVPNWTYSFPHDLIVKDDNNNVGIGDWYEAGEGVFYMPKSTPPDLPQELQQPEE